MGITQSEACPPLRENVLKIIKIIFVITLGLFIQTTFAKEPDKNLENIFSFKRIGRVAPSDDGKSVVYIVKEKDKNSEKWVYSLFLKTSNNSNQLLYKSNNSISIPKWSHDGNKLAYVSQGEKFDSIWIYANGTLNKFLEFHDDISNFQWAPNGKYIAFISTDNNNQASTLIDVEKNYKNNQLYIVQVNNAQQIDVLTPDNISISPGFLLPGFDWSPDSKKIVFTYQDKPGMNDPYQGKIGFIEIASKKISRLPYAEDHAVGQVSYSPDGNWIAFESGMGSLKEKRTLYNNPYINNQICIANTNTFKTSCLSKTPDESSLLLGWTQKSDGVFVVENYKTLGSRIYLLPMNLNGAKLISDVPGYMDLPTITLSSNHAYFGFRYETFTNAPEAYISQSAPFTLEQVSHIQNQTQTILGNSKTIQWKSKDNTPIEGLLITPHGYNPKIQYPLYVDIHGGPADTWVNRFANGCDEHGDLFVPTSCTRNLLDLGFIIFQPNIRGSDGYGKKFRVANVGDLGGKDYQDIMTGIDYLSHQNIIDQHRIVIAGWSYGGFMTAWAITQSNRFKLAIDGGGKTDMVSFAGTTDMGWIQPQYFGVNFWENRDLYLNHSAIFKIKNIKTPLLILHGQNDKRVPIGQAYEFYAALTAQNKKVKMSVMPRTGHAPIDPSIIGASVIAINKWLVQFS